MKHPGHTYGGFVPAISERGMTSLLIAANVSHPIQKMIGIGWLRSADTNNLIFGIGCTMPADTNNPRV
jgi:hypothetical protein